MKTWTCRIGQVSDAALPAGADSPLRRAVQAAYQEITGQVPDFTESGWGEETPLLGLATTEQLLAELVTRMKLTAPGTYISEKLVVACQDSLETLAPETLAYRTVDECPSLTRRPVDADH